MKIDKPKLQEINMKHQLKIYLYHNRKIVRKKERKFYRKEEIKRSPSLAIKITWIRKVLLKI